MFSEIIHKRIIIDHFEDFFNSLQVKICLSITLISELFTSNIGNALFILFEKYGEDSMKRSLYNQIISQIGYPGILSSLLVTPIWIWRLVFGPLNFVVADFAVFLRKYKIWFL